MAPLFCCLMPIDYPGDRSCQPNGPVNSCRIIYNSAWFILQRGELSVC